MTHCTRLAATITVAAICAFATSAPSYASTTKLQRDFASPPDAARPWVYWYFMDGNQTQKGMHADLEAMKRAGIGGMIILDVDIGIPRGPVAFMSPQWQADFAYAVGEAKRLGLQIALGTGPGWCGAGGPWITPDESMQHIVSSETHVTGPVAFDGVLERPKQHSPYFGDYSMNDALKKEWENYYKDEYVLAFPTPAGDLRTANIGEKALYYRPGYSGNGAVPRLPSPINGVTTDGGNCVPATSIIDISRYMDTDGHLRWNAPAGNWTIMRFGRTSTGQTTRPSPEAGLGFETNKFETSAVDVQLHNFEDKLIGKLGPHPMVGNAGLTTLHYDSWEVSSQNWSPHFRQEFIKRRGYDLVPYLPAMAGYVVGTPEKTERFLWDLRDVAAELVVENQGGYLARYAHKHGMTFSIEPYDLNPSGDLDLGGISDLPMGEFWSKKYGLSTEFSVVEATSIGHTNGRKVIGAESFTSTGDENWLQYPGSMKEQLDWAICAGLNKFVIHRMQHQPELDQYPGMTMGPYGVHWDRTQTWWDMVPAFHAYMARCSNLLRQGLPVSDILYLTPEGAPQVFTPPETAFVDHNEFADRRGYSFDGCSPKNLIARASVKDGKIVFPDGMSYRILILPRWNSMTPDLLRKITRLVNAGATVVGAPPTASPSLIDYPTCDAQVKSMSAHLWSGHKVGLGHVVLDRVTPVASLENARWIWFAEGAPGQSAPVATRYYRTTVNVDAKPLRSATVTLTADNAFTLKINGRLVGQGDNWRNPLTFDIVRDFKPGANDIEVVARNEGDSPNPAGLIASIQLTYADGSQRTVNTDTTWTAAQSSIGPWTTAVDLGARGVGPWSIGPAAPALYEDYSTTAHRLAAMNVPVDFASTTPMRYIHRHLDDGGDVYFVGNALAASVDARCTFRVTGRAPEWWDPVDGKMRALPNYSSARGVTTVPISLAAGESGFVVFEKPADKPKSSPNFPTHRPVLTLSKPWTVSFDPKWGGPSNVIFAHLDDWSQRPEPGIKYYSGKATYTTTFDAPTSTKGLSLSLGDVKDLASVKLNGKALGSVWCAPWRLSIAASALQPKGNKLEITVANLWSNRLIGDAGKPEAERLSHTTYTEYTSASPLQPSGLLGPVTIEAPKWR